VRMSVLLHRQSLSGGRKRPLRCALAIGTIGTLLVSASSTWAEEVAARSTQSAVVSTTSAPVGAEASAVQWLKIDVAGLGVMLAAVARPHGDGPFPSVLLLHGSHGFAREYVELAGELARDGLLAVAVCWFSGTSGGDGGRFVTPIACPDAPPMPMAASPEALRTIGALVQVMRAVPGVRADRIALFGHSRGGGAALNYILSEDAVEAAVLNSAGYPDELAQRVDRIQVPLLILHGTADAPSDGGSPMTSIRMARQFEAALRRAGKTVDGVYYPGGRHNGIFANAAQRADEIRRISAFLRRHLGDATAGHAHPAAEKP
jgi:dienelactone hydrolase